QARRRAGGGVGGERNHDVTLVGELDGVFDEMFNHLRQAHGVDADGGNVLGEPDVKAEALCDRGGAVFVSHAIHDRNDVRRLVGQLHVTPSDDRVLEHVLDHVEQALAVGPHAFEQFDV